MRKSGRGSPAPFFRQLLATKADGFSLVEFLVSATILLVLSAGVFTMLTDAQGTSGYQGEVLEVMENSRLTMSVLGRYIIQAGNNPRSASFTPLTITGATQVRLCADLTGSAGNDQGDPDGDILDADEDVTIRYNSGAKSLELVDRNGTVRTLARTIAGFSMEYLNANGAATTVATDVRSIRVTLTGLSSAANPRTGKTFGQTVTGLFTLPNQG